ncbi:MAG: acVLRF1 family peptidyl-tRNA hydrolase [Propionicimonas sp.]
MAALPSPERTIRVDPDRLEGWITRFADRHGPLDPQPGDDRLRLTAADGAVAELLLWWGPLPDGDPVTAAIAAFRQERTVGVLLVRRKAHGVGVFDGPRLRTGRHHSHYVQGRTKAGGWSQQRYARRRSNQADRAFADAAEDAAAVLLPVLAELDAVVTGGDGAAVRAVLSTPGLERLQELAAAGRHPVHSVPDPNHGVLAGFGATFRAVPIRLNELA